MDFLTIVLVVIAAPFVVPAVLFAAFMILSGVFIGVCKLFESGLAQLFVVLWSFIFILQKGQTGLACFVLVCYFFALSCMNENQA